MNFCDETDGLRRNRRRWNEVRLRRSRAHRLTCRTATFATTGAQATLAECVEFFRAAERKHGPMGALGFSCFGPLELRPDAAAYGCMMSTPKVGWSGVNCSRRCARPSPMPIALDTDVGGAALAEVETSARVVAFLRSPMSPWARGLAAL